MIKTQLNVLFTGSTGKLGSAFIQKFSGIHRIAGVARKSDARSAGYEFIQGDITKDADRIVEEALTRLGGIDLLVNGAVYYHYKPLLEMREEEIQKQFETNLFAPIKLTKALLKQSWGMSKEENLKRNRSIVNVASMAALDVIKGGQSVYAMTKASLFNLTAHMADEFLQFGIRVNGVAPREPAAWADVIDQIEDLGVSSDTKVVRGI